MIGCHWIIGALQSKKVSQRYKRYISNGLLIYNINMYLQGNYSVLVLISCTYVWLPSLFTFGCIFDWSHHVYSDLVAFWFGRLSQWIDMVFIYFSTFEYLCTNKTTLEYSHHKSHVILPKTYFGIKSYEMVVDNFSLK